MPKYYICKSKSFNLTIGKKYISYQPEDYNPDATWINVVDDSGFIHSHSQELFKTIDEVREEKLDNILKR